MNDEALRFIRYLSFKMDCLRHQEANPLTLNAEKAKKHSGELEVIISEKTEALSKVMPKVVSKVKNKPKNLFNKDGAYSKIGKEWFDTLKGMRLPEDTEGPVPIEYSLGNPGSTPQVKEWLFSLGWKPDHFKYERNKINGEEKKIPQVRYIRGDRKGELTDSVLNLKSREPQLELLEGLTVAQHRKTVFDGFLRNYTIDQWNDYPKDDSDSLEVRTGKIVASAEGFANTLRLKHRAPIVNLPGVDSVWGKEIRGCLVAPSGEVVCSNCGRDFGDIATPECSCGGMPYQKDYVLCGSDVSSLESSTKRHYMWPHDPEYVKEMSQPGFDEHINLAKFAGALTEDEERFYQWYQLQN